MNGIFGKIVAAAFGAAIAFGAARAEAANLYVTEYANGVTFVGTAQAQIPPQPAITDQTVALSGVAAISNPFNAKTHVVSLICDEGCSIAIGANPTATVSNFLLQQGQAVNLGVSPGMKVSAIANVAGNAGGSSSTPFTPTGSAVLTAGTSSTNVALPTADPVLVIQNTGSVQAYFTLGVGAGTTATTNNVPPGSSYSLPAGVCLAVGVGSNTYFAAITATSTTTINIIQGSGTPTACGGSSGGGGGSSVTNFTPKGAATLSVSTVSANVILPTTDPTLIIQNVGTANLFFNLGVGSGTSASVSNFSLPAGLQMAVAVGSNTYIAAITAAGNTTLNVIQGTGTPQISGTSSLVSNCISSSSAPVYFAGSNACSTDLSGQMRITADPTQVYPAGNASGLSTASISADTLPLNSTGTPFTVTQINITGTTSPSNLAASTSKQVYIYKMMLACAGTQTVDFQNASGGQHLLGGPWPCGSNGGIVLDLDGTAWMTSLVSDGIKLVLSTSAAVTGVIFSITQ